MWIDVLCLSDGNHDKFGIESPNGKHENDDWFSKQKIYFPEKIHTELRKKTNDSENLSQVRVKIFTQLQEHPIWRRRRQKFTISFFLIYCI